VKELGEARKLVKAARRVLVLSGAGISAESGLATFRGSDGLWENHRIEDVATPEAFERDPALVWRFYNLRRKNAAEVSPNAGHAALAGLAKKKEVRVVTQNVDGLHQKAGSKDVVELHGSLWRVRCAKCASRVEDLPLEVPYPSRCPDCSGLLRPDIVWFGENLDPMVMMEAAACLELADVVLVVGTSAQVYPAASFAFEAAQRGIGVIEVNPEETAFSRKAGLSLRGKSGEILPRLFAEI
jgi:NAD-dependent deacetylase